MTQQIRNIIKGIGSVMVIMPYTDYRRFVPKDTPQDRMRKHWERTGKYLKHAIESFTDEQKKKQ